MAQPFHFHEEPTLTSSPKAVRAWIEDLNPSFLTYGGKFERAKINGVKLFNITRQKLKELGIVRTDHQTVILNAITNLKQKNKGEEQAMQGEDQNEKKMPNRFTKQSEYLEHAIDRLLVRISERRKVRSLHGTTDHPRHSILSPSLELIEVIKMILSILERPPLQSKSEFSSLKRHLIQYIALLKYFSEQSDLTYEMESEVVDVCKNVTKMGHYIIALPPEATEPKESPPSEELPTATESEGMISLVEHGSNYVPPTRDLLKPVNITSSSSECVLPSQDTSLQNKVKLYGYEHSFPEGLSTPSNEGAVLMPQDKGNKSETDVSGTKCSATLSAYFDHKSFQDLLIIESDLPLTDSSSEKHVIDLDSDGNCDSDYDSERHLEDSDSDLWELDSDSDVCPLDSAPVKDLLETKNYQMASGSVNDPVKVKQHLVEVEQFQMSSDSLSYWMGLYSEKSMGNSDSESYLSSGGERPEIDLDLEKYSVAFSPVRHLVKEEKCLMAADSIKRLMESEQVMTGIPQHLTLSASKKYVTEADMEKDKMGSASPSQEHGTGKEKHRDKTRSKRCTVDSDSEPCGTDSDSKKPAPATAAVKCLLDTQIYPLSTDTEGHLVNSPPEGHPTDLNPESLGMASDSVKHMKKARSCQSESELARIQIDFKSESENTGTDSERQELDFDSVKGSDSSGRYQQRSARLEGDSERRQGDFSTHRDDLERHQTDSDSKEHRADSEKEKYHHASEMERHTMEMEREQSLIESGIERLQVGEEQQKHDTDADRKKGHQIASANERHRLESEEEALRLGARKKGNRPEGFWRPLSSLPPCGQTKKTEGKHSVPLSGSKVSRIQHVRYLSYKNIARCEEVSPTLSDEQKSEGNLTEQHSHNLSSSTLADNKHQRNAGNRNSLSKHYNKYKYLQRFQAALSQIKPFNLLCAEDSTLEVSVPECHTTCMSPCSASCPRIRTYLLDTGTTTCSKCFMEINNSSLHKCPWDSDNDLEPDCPSDPQIPLGSEYSLSPKSGTSPLSPSLDPEHSVDIRCSLQQRDSKYSSHSDSYLHCESSSALQNLIGSTVTPTFSMTPQNTMSRHNTSRPDNTINIGNVVGLESEDQFKLTAQLESSASAASEMTMVGADDLKYEDKPLLKHERDHKNETDSEHETDSEEEEDPKDEDDPEDENDPEDKKEPEDKSDPDDTDPKGGSGGTGADASSGSESSSGADPTSGAGSNSGGDTNNGRGANSESDSDIDKGSSNDAENDRYTNNIDNGSGLGSDVDQNCTAGFNNDTNPNHTSELQNESGMDYVSSSNSGAGLSNATRPGNGICLNKNTGTNEAIPNNNRPDCNLNGSGLQVNGPGPQKSRQGPSIPDFSNSGFSININGLDSKNSSVLNSSPNHTNNTSVLNEDPESNKNARPSHATSYNNAFSSNKNVDPNYDTKPASAAGHNFSTVPNYYSDLDYVPRFTHAGSPSFVVSPTYIAKNGYALRPSSATSNDNVACTSCASDTNLETRFTHVIASDFVISPNYDAINTLNVHNSTSTSNMNNISEPKLEIGSSFSIPNTAYCSTLTLAAGANYTFPPENMTTSTFFYSYNFGRNYTISDDHKFDVVSKGNDGSVDSSIFMHTTQSKDVLDAKESGLLKYFSRVQKPIGIKDPASLHFHCNSNSLLLSCDTVVEAEKPDVVKFAVSSGSVNRFFKSLFSCCGIFRTEEKSCRAEGPAQKSPEETSWRLKEELPVMSEGGLAVRASRSHSVSPARGYAERPEGDLAERHARTPAVSPARGRTERHTRGRVEKHPRACTVSPPKCLTVSPERGRSLTPAREPTERRARRPSVSPRGRHTAPDAGECAERPSRRSVWSPPVRYAGGPAHGLAVEPARRAVSPPRPTMRPAEKVVLGSAIRIPVKPAEGCAGKTSKSSAGRSTRSTTDRNQNRRLFPDQTAVTNIFTKAEPQNWINLSYVQSDSLSFFSEEDVFFWSRTQFYDMACSELGHGKCEGWLWKKTESNIIPFYIWKRCWFSLNQSTLYWFSGMSETKPDGFIYLPEFRIILTSHCTRNNAFKASHARIKSLYFAADSLDEMNYWVARLLELAYGYSFGDAVANAGYRHVSATTYADCILALTRQFPVIWCSRCHRPSTIVSLKSAFRRKRVRDMSEEFVYFRPADDNAQEEARTQNQQNPTMTSNQLSQEEHGRPQAPRPRWLDSPESAEAPGHDGLEEARSTSPVRERTTIRRRSWEALLEAPLNSKGLHILQTIPADETEIGYRQLPLEETPQASTSQRSPHLQALPGPFPLLPQSPKLQRQQICSLRPDSDISSPIPSAHALAVNPEGTHFFPTDHTLFTGGNAKERDNREEAWQKPILSAPGEHPPINPSFENFSAMGGQLGLPANNSQYPRGNVRFPTNNLFMRRNAEVSIDNYGIPMVPLDNFGGPRGSGEVQMRNLEVPGGSGGLPRHHDIRIPMGSVETSRNSAGTSRRVVSSPFLELSKIGEHCL